MGAISAMYDLTLATALASAQSDMETREITMDASLREVAGAHPDARALVKISLQGPERRRSNHTGMLPRPIQSDLGHEI